MLLRQVALISDVSHSQISFSELTKVSAALQKQASRDFSPIWEVNATIDAFHKLEDVPTGYWPIIIKNDIKEPGAAGVHEDKKGQPFALVQFDESWPLTASHECLEMLADPFGNRLIAGQSPMKRQGRVEFLVEVCDPSEDSAFAYRVNGMTVSDFYTPHFFEPVASSGVRYSFTDAIKKPRQVLQGGYLSWHDPVSDHWYQETFFGAKKSFRDLGVFGKLEESLRSTINRLTFKALEFSAMTTQRLAVARRAEKMVDDSTNAEAASLRAYINKLIAQAKADAKAYNSINAKANGSGKRAAAIAGR